MHLCRVQIKNFRNFSSLDVPLGADVVLVGENRVGKSNFIFALRLVLDAALPDSARQLKLTDINDSCDLSKSPEIQIDLDFADFEGDPNLVALLTDYRLATDHKIARLSYFLRKKAGVTAAPKSEADFEFKVFGGADEARPLRNDVRRRICMDVLHALRDAEGELGSWRSSPLRPLLEDAIAKVPKANLDPLAADLAATTQKLGALPPIKALEDALRKQISDLAGASQDMKARLAFAPTDPLRLFRSIGLFIDDGKRSIADASLGSANLALLALRLAEFSWRHAKNERNFTFVCVEEPEAHLHPHLQRQVFRRLFQEDQRQPRSLLLTTHSPNIASVSPLRSIVLLKSKAANDTRAYSLAALNLSNDEIEDLQRYLDVTRAELLFSRGAIFVEGDAEAALLPVFAKTLRIDLDQLGITVCNVGGVNFSPYVKFATALSLPFVVITDWDPLEGKNPPLGRARALKLIDDIESMVGRAMSNMRRLVLERDEGKLRAQAVAAGIYMNTSTLEVEIAGTALSTPLLSILEAENFGATRRKRLATWKADPSKVNGEQLLAMIADLGKGRLAGRLAARAVGLPPPAYIEAAIRHVAKNVG
jgi:putative ATP-dependent endonuclease of the OLD family